MGKCPHRYYSPRTCSEQKEISGGRKCVVLISVYWAEVENSEHANLRWWCLQQVSKSYGRKPHNVLKDWWKINLYHAGVSNSYLLRHPTTLHHHPNRFLQTSEEKCKNNYWGRQPSLESKRLPQNRKCFISVTRAQNTFTKHLSSEPGNIKNQSKWWRSKHWIQKKWNSGPMEPKRNLFAVISGLFQTTAAGGFIFTGDLWVTMNLLQKHPAAPLLLTFKEQYNSTGYAKCFLCITTSGSISVDVQPPLHNPPPGVLCI